jgi:hypothetical protein
MAAATAQAARDYAAERLARLLELHDLRERMGDRQGALSTRGLARTFCERRGIETPAWAARLSGGPAVRRKPAPAPLTASVAERAEAPIECPRYASVRDWAAADSGNRGLSWGTDGSVQLIWIYSDLDRRRSQRFHSGAAAIDALTAGTVQWRKGKPLVKPKRGRPMPPTAHP